METKKDKEKLSKKNSEGYNDLTAYKGIKAAESDRERHRKMIGALLRMCELGDYYMESRIVLRDKRTGKVWE